MLVEVWSAGARVGYISTVQSGARMTTPLDKVGSFSFSCSASDPDADKLVNGYTVYGYENGALRLSGIIGTIDKATSDGVPILQVSGDAIARELVQARSGEVALSEAGWATAVGVSAVHIDSGTGAGSGAYLLTESFDKDNATPVAGADFTDNDKWLYIGGATPFTTIQFVCEILAGGDGGGTWGNGNPGGPSAQYFDGTDWIGFTMVSDTTIVAGNSFAQNGVMTISLSGGPMKQTTEHGVSAYFIRGRFNNSADRIRIGEVQTWGLVPTDTALALVAATFPTVANGYAGTWTLDTVTGLSATVKTDVYDTIARGTVFEALTKLAELTGEHFYCTADRKVVWIGNTLASSGIHIYSPPEPRLVETDATVALLTSLKVSKDSHERVTRVYPHGAGLGAGSLDLTYVTDAWVAALPAGYAISRVNGYIRIDPEGTRNELDVDFKDIGPETADIRARENAADALASAGLVWLGRHSAVLESYDVECTNLAASAVKPGNKVWVEYQEWVAGVKTIDVNDANLIVLQITETFGESAAVTAGLTVSTVAQWPVTDKEFEARMYRNQRAMGSTPQAVGVADVRTADFAVDARPMGLGGGGLAFTGSSPASGSGGGGGGGMAIHDILSGWHSVAAAGAGRFFRTDSATSAVLALIADADLPSSIGRTSRQIISGAGLTGGGDLSADRTLAVGAGLGLTVNADDVALTTPGTLSASSTNASAGSHTHAITAVDTSTAAAALMKTNASGGFTFADGAQFGYGDAGLVRPVANGLAPASGDHLQSTTYTAGVAGWRITDDGKAEFQDGYFRGELHASVFVKDMIEAHAGTMVIAKSAGKLSRDMTVPTSGTWYMYLADPPGGGYLFTDNDIARVKAETANGVLDVWFVVSGRATTGGGEQRYTCTYSSGSHAAQYVYAKGSVCMDYGVSGQGYLLMTADLSGAPYYDVRTHAGAPWTTETLRVRLGNLNGSYGISSDLYGIGMGDATAATDFLRYDPTNGLRIQAIGGGLNIDPVGIKLGVSTGYQAKSSLSLGKTPFASWVSVGELWGYDNGTGSAGLVLETKPLTSTQGLLALRAAGGSTSIGSQVSLEALFASAGNGAFFRLVRGVSDSYAQLSGISHLEMYDGDITLATTHFVGLSAAQGRIVFTDAAPDTVSIYDATFQTIGTTGTTQMRVGDPALTKPLVGIYADATNDIGYVQTRSNHALGIGTNNVEKLRITAAGLFGFLTNAPDVVMDINSDNIRVRTAKTPASASAAGYAGQICWDADALYVCTATNTWKKVAIATW